MVIEIFWFPHVYNKRGKTDRFCLCVVLDEMLEGLRVVLLDIIGKWISSGHDAAAAVRLLYLQANRISSRVL
jgi:hypothetical protein